MYPNNKSQSSPTQWGFIAIVRAPPHSGAYRAKWYCDSNKGGPRPLFYFLFFCYNGVTMAEKNEYLDKIENLIYSAGKFNDMSFRMVLEGVVNKAGEDGEMLLVRYINSKEIDPDTRLNIIRVSGYVQSPHFLVPLKKIIDTEDNIHIKKEAVISVSKYNDRRALNILNYALNNIKNPLLLDTINTEIGKIKRNNPVFALLPRFLDGEKNPKNFEVTLGILKRILNAVDANMFVSYLNCGKPVIENGAFEILCHTGDVNHQSVILRFFQDRFNQVPCINFPECEELYSLTLKLKRYYLRFPSLIDEQLENLGTQLFYAKDIRVRGLFMSILCRSHGAPAITFVSGVYDANPDLRETVIIEYSGNEAAADLLFDKYPAVEPSLKGLIIKSLLNSEKGITFFFEQFASLAEDEQEIVVNCLPYGGTHNLSEFMIMIFGFDRHELKDILLTKVKDHYEFSVKEVLFDQDKKQEFAFMEKKHLATIGQLFPISTAKYLLEEICYEDLPLSRTKKYLESMDRVLTPTPAIRMPQQGLVNMFVHKVVAHNNPDLFQLLVGILKKIKAFDMTSYANLNESIGMFTTGREKKLSIQEEDELRKVRKSLKDLYLDIKRTDEDLKNFDRMLAPPEPDFERVGSFITQNSLSIALQIDHVAQTIGERLEKADRDEVKRWLQLFNKFPMLAYRLKEDIREKAETGKGPENMVLFKFYQALPMDPIKIVIRLTSRQSTAVLREQFQEIIPDIPVYTETEEVNEEDMLLCDTITLKDFILKGVLPSKLFLFLENISEFENFKTYNPRPFLKSLSAYRIMKEILKELYL